MLKSVFFLSGGILGFAQAGYVTTLSPNAQQMFNESMSWMDNYYDTSAGYLYNFGATSALRHETRSSAWYALGLLARNAGSDVAEAERIITNIIIGQYKDPSEQWYGDYQQEPEEPYVGSPNYPSHIYGSFDPNWRGFVGTTFVMAIEEFGALLSDAAQDLILESLVNATVGDSYRVGGVDDDNLYASYSNPSIMRALVSGWTGRRVGDRNMTMAGEAYAQEIIDLFNLHQTLSEFNSGTYTGVSLFGLTLWSKYLPQCSVMTRNGPGMLRATWNAVSQLWHPGMKNMAGPWDRAYGYDMNKYVSLMALWFWTLIGKENSSLIAKVCFPLINHSILGSSITGHHSRKSCLTWPTTPGLPCSPCWPTSISRSYPMRPLRSSLTLRVSARSTPRRTIRPMTSRREISPLGSRRS
jgi:hypothetical protein